MRYQINIAIVSFYILSLALIGSKQHTIKQVPAKVSTHVQDSIWDNFRFFQELIQYEIGDTIDLSGVIIEVSGRPISIFNSYTFTGGTFRRGCPANTTLKIASEDQTDTIVVNSSSEFEEGDWILIVNGPEFQNNSGGQALSIKEIIDDTIIMHNSFQTAMDSSAIVVHQFPLVRPILDQGESITFNGTIFDGRKSCNNFIYDWRYNQTINVKTGVELINCIFQNTPSENIFMC
ncbi:MAG: hypothetical protein AAFY76_15050, partial [Cyanobacteria bacterium J06649_11]